MPLEVYSCNECGFKKEHFSTKSGKVRKCPKCKSDEYLRCLGRFKSNVEYSSVEEIMENEIDPAVERVKETIGREALDQDTKTLENLFGQDKVEKTFSSTDD